jgi:hypothetical protein
MCCKEERVGLGQESQIEDSRSLKYVVKRRKVNLNKEIKLSIGYPSISIVIELQLVRHRFISDRSVHINQFVMVSL